MRDQVLSISMLSKTYPHQIGSALSCISMCIYRGECVVLLGPNGAGKSTLLSILKTRLSQDEGEFYVDGVDGIVSPSIVRGMIAYVPQLDDLDEGLSVIDSLVFHGRYFGMSVSSARSAAVRVMESLNILELASQRILSLSGGQRQRVLWARALTHDPSLLVLDEPSTGLDLYGKRDTHLLVQSAKEFNLGILMATHDLSEAKELADRVIIMHRGKIVGEGPPEEIGCILEIGEEVANLRLDVDDGDVHAVSRLLSEIRRLEGVVKTDYFEKARSAFKVHMTGDTDGVVQSVVNRISSSGLTLLSLERRSVDLEDVFFEVTSE